MFYACFHNQMMKPNISNRLLEIVDSLPLKNGIQILVIDRGPGGPAREIANRIENGYVLGNLATPLTVLGKFLKYNHKDVVFDIESINFQRIVRYSIPSITLLGAKDHYAFDTSERRKTIIFPIDRCGDHYSIRVFQSGLGLPFLAYNLNIIKI